MVYSGNKLLLFTETFTAQARPSLQSQRLIQKSVSVKLQGYGILSYDELHSKTY